MRGKEGKEGNIYTSQKSQRETENMAKDRKKEKGHVREGEER